MPILQTFNTCSPLKKLPTSKGQISSKFWHSFAPNVFSVVYVFYLGPFLHTIKMGTNIKRASDPKSIWHSYPPILTYKFLYRF